MTLNVIANVLRTRHGITAIPELRREGIAVQVDSDLLYRLDVRSTHFYAEYRPLKTVPVSEVSFSDGGVLMQQVTAFWPHWLIYNADARLVLFVQVELSETAGT